MSTSNSLNVLTPKLNPIGQRRLFEFLDVVDTNTAARFRGWLSAATDGEVGAAAVLLNRSSHGREFAKWWQDRDTTPNSAAQSHAPQRSFSSGAGRDVRSRSTRSSGIPWIILGYALMLMARLSTLAGDAGALLGLVLGLVGLIVELGGCMKYAEEKGYSKWLGLVGLLSCLGLLILLMLPDRYRARW